MAFEVSCQPCRCTKVTNPLPPLWGIPPLLVFLPSAPLPSYNHPYHSEYPRRGPSMSTKRTMQQHRFQEPSPATEGQTSDSNSGSTIESSDSGRAITAIQMSRCVRQPQGFRADYIKAIERGRHY